MWARLAIFNVTFLVIIPDNYRSILQNPIVNQVMASLEVLSHMRTCSELRTIVSSLEASTESNYVGAFEDFLCSCTHQHVDVSEIMDHRLANSILTRGPRQRRRHSAEVQMHVQVVLMRIWYWTRSLLSGKQRTSVRSGNQKLTWTCYAAVQFFRDFIRKLFLSRLK